MNACAWRSVRLPGLCELMPETPGSRANRKLLLTDIFYPPSDVEVFHLNLCGEEKAKVLDSFG